VMRGGAAASRSARPRVPWIWRSRDANGMSRTVCHPPVQKEKRQRRTRPGHRVASRSL
jgi:hypothetical protein